MKVYIILSLIIGTYGYPDTLSTYLDSIDDLTKNILKKAEQQVANATNYANQALQRAAEAGKLDATHGSVILHNNGGTSTSITSGILPNGEHYTRIIEVYRVGDKLHRIVTERNENTKEEKVQRETIDLNAPNGNTQVMESHPKTN